MSTQFITNDKGERTAVIIPIAEYEDFLHLHNLNLELTEDYKRMIDKMLEDEKSGEAQYVSYPAVKDKFLRK